VPIKQVVDQEKFKSIAFNLSEGEISDIHDFSDGYYILQVSKRIPERIPELKEIRRRVRSDLIKEKQNKKASEDANRLLEVLKNGASMYTESRKYNLVPNSTGFFKRNDEIPNIGYEREISKVAFKLSTTTPLPEQVLHGKSGYYVIRLKNRKEPDDKEFYDIKNDIIKRLLEKKQSKTFELWLAQVKRESEITIEDDFKKL
jgi:peptidyl-prolyl cis-trans isomerase D